MLRIKKPKEVQNYWGIEIIESTHIPKLLTD